MHNNALITLLTLVPSGVYKYNGEHVKTVLPLEVMPSAYVI